MDIDSPYKNKLGTLVKVTSPNGRTHYARVIGFEGRLLHLKAEFSASWTPIRKGSVNVYDPFWVSEWDVEPRD
jgi:hypothetical protein